MHNIKHNELKNLAKSKVSLSRFAYGPFISFKRSFVIQSIFFSFLLLGYLYLGITRLSISETFPFILVVIAWVIFVFSFVLMQRLNLRFYKVYKNDKITKGKVLCTFNFLYNKRIDYEYEVDGTKYENQVFFRHIILEITEIDLSDGATIPIIYDEQDPNFSSIYTPYNAARYN